MSRDIRLQENVTLFAVLAQVEALHFFLACRPASPSSASSTFRMTNVATMAKQPGNDDGHQLADQQIAPLQ